LLRDREGVTADFSKKGTTAKELLELAVKGLGITVKCPVDFPLVGIKLTKASGLQILDYIKEASDHTLAIYFLQPDVLWCGLVYTAYADANAGNMFGFPTVRYRMGYNCIKDNRLKERIPNELVQVIYSGKLASGLAVHTESKDKSAKRKVTGLMNHVPDNATLGKFAQEKEHSMNYRGYEGSITAFGEPYCLPGYDAFIRDDRYPKLAGTYLITGTEVSFGMGGMRRVATIGPKVGN
jgi:hypothetical protein